MIQLQDNDLLVRSLRYRDHREWDQVRRRNAAWLEPWEATNPDPRTAIPSFGAYVRHMRRLERQQVGYGFMMEVASEIIGHVTLTGIQRGSLQSGVIGYWIAQGHAGQGYTPRAVAMVCDFGFFEAGLHRIEINIRPENRASLRVVEKLGFRDEGIRERYLHIQGQWCDHRTFALTREEIGEGLLEQLHDRQNHFYNLEPRSDSAS